MGLPEPTFKINAFQLETILKEYGVEWQNYSDETREKFIKELRRTCFEHLDTAKL